MPVDAVSRRAHATWQVLLKELGAFGVVGGICLLIDVGLFQLLYVHTDVGAVTAKLLATLVSMTAAYVGHRYWSFSRRSRIGVRREYLFFAVINGVTLLLGLAIVWTVRHPFGQEGSLVLQLANLASIAVGTLIRYLAYRRWVFPAPTPAPERLAAPSTAAVDEPVQG